MADSTRLDNLISWLQEQEAHMLEKALKLSKDPQAAERRQSCLTTAQTLTWVIEQAIQFRDGEVPPPPPPATTGWLQRVKDMLAA